MDGKAGGRENCGMADKLDRMAAQPDKNRPRGFDYLKESDLLIIYDEALNPTREFFRFTETAAASSLLDAEAKASLLAFAADGKPDRPVNIRVAWSESETCVLAVEASLLWRDARGRSVITGNITMRTGSRDCRILLERLLCQDSPIRVYGPTAVKRRVEDYLKHKSLYDACGLVLMELDSKEKPDGALDDRLLIELARRLRTVFTGDGVVMRTDGGEFVILVKKITHLDLVKKAMRMMEAMRPLKAGPCGERFSASAGICFLPVNLSGYSYENMLGNALWALRRARTNGGDQYIFCDHLKRFQNEASFETLLPPEGRDRLRDSDILMSAFRLFDMASGFQAAVSQLLPLIGARFDLDRITIIQTDVQDQKVRQHYQWTAPEAPAVLEHSRSFTKEDFITLFKSYDEYGAVVLQHDDLGMYSPDGAALLMQGGAKTVLYCAMYCEGKYIGAVSYAVCREKRHFTRDERVRLSCLTKITSAHLSKSLSLDKVHRRINSLPDYDALTGLISFSRFREQAAHLVMIQNDAPHFLVYSDFIDFQHFNKLYGYDAGDAVLREFGSFLADRLRSQEGSLLTRVVSDQFLLFLPYSGTDEDARRLVQRVNDSFIRMMNERHPDAGLRLRSGIYRIVEGCGVSKAIDIANYVRKQIGSGSTELVRLFDKRIEARQRLEDEIVNGMDAGLRNDEFQIYLQPKFSVQNERLTGAEALVRWQRADGRFLSPAEFIPLYELNGRIVELDYYVFEQVAKYLAGRMRLGKRVVPVSVNASILHVHKERTLNTLVDILSGYRIDPSLIEIELTETSTVTVYEHVKKLFNRLREAGFHTALDDFGAGYSLLNAIMDIPVDTIKIDQKLILGCDKDGGIGYFLRQLIRLLRELGYRIVCEGIETARQSDVLKSIGDVDVQGFYYARPMPLHAFDAFLDRRLP